jgi:hypothetical protein
MTRDTMKEDDDRVHAITKKAVGILLSSGVSAQDGDNALALALSSQNPD